MVIAAFSLLFGGLAASVSPVWLLATVASVAAAFVTFFSPRTGLGMLVFSMLLSPEIGLGGGLSGGDRGVVIRYDDLLLAVVFFSWLARMAIVKTKPFLFHTPVHLPIFFYTLICVFSTGLGILRGDVRFQTSFFYVLKYVEYFLLYFMTVNVIESREDVKRYLVYGLITAALVTAYAYWYYAASGFAVRTTAPFEAPIGQEGISEPGSLGGYYLVVFGILLGMLAEASGRWLKVSFFALLAMLPSFLLSLSRASYAGLVVSFAALMFLSSKRRLKMLFLAVALFVIGASVTSISKPVTERVLVTFKGGQNLTLERVQVAGGASVAVETSAAQRVRAWRRVLTEDLPRHPLLGNGVTGIRFLDTQYGLVLGELGVTGLFIFLWMISRIYRAGKRLYAGETESWARGLALGFSAGLAGLLFQSFSTNTFIIVRVMEPFWFLTAAVAWLHSAQPARPAQAAEKIGTV